MQNWPYAAHMRAYVTTYAGIRRGIVRTSHCCCLEPILNYHITLPLVLHRPCMCTSMCTCSVLLLHTPAYCALCDCMCACIHLYPRSSTYQSCRWAYAFPHTIVNAIHVLSVVRVCTHMWCTCACTHTFHACTILHWWSLSLEHVCWCAFLLVRQPFHHGACFLCCCLTRPNAWPRSYLGLKCGIDCAFELKRRCFWFRCWFVLSAVNNNLDNIRWGFGFFWIPRNSIPVDTLITRTMAFCLFVCLFVWADSFFTPLGFRVDKHRHVFKLGVRRIFACFVRVGIVHVYFFQSTRVGVDIVDFFAFQLSAEDVRVYVCVYGLCLRLHCRFVRGLLC